MNTDLRESIIRHILSNFAIIPSNFVNVKTKSLKSKEFLLNETISFTDENNEIIKNKIWGCSISIESKEMKILLGDCSQDNVTEYCLLVSLKDNPIYGLYIILDDDLNSEGMIACSLDGKQWMECQTYLQATFLAAMEQLKEVGSNWKKCTEYKDQYLAMLSFIKFHHKAYGA